MATRLGSAGLGRWPVVSEAGGARWLALLVLGLLLGLVRLAQAADRLPTVLPVTLRVRGGLAIHATESEWVMGRVSGALDLALSVPLTFETRLGAGDGLNNIAFLSPELGYSYQDSGQHLFTVGAHAGYGHLFLHGSYSLRFVAGRQSDQTGLGLRHGIGVHAIYDVLSLEVNHQPLWVAGQAQHDVILWLGCNLLQIVNLYGLLGTGP